MDREPGAFKWGLGNDEGADDTSPQVTPRPSSRQAFDDQFIAPRQTAQGNQFGQQGQTGTQRQLYVEDDDGVSYNANDLGFRSQDIPRRGVVRRMIGPLIFILIFVGLIGGAVYGADKLARDAVTGIISDKIATTLKLPSEKGVSVDLGDGLFIVQAVTGSIDTVHIIVKGATFGGFTGDLVLDATGVPTDQSQPTETLKVNLALDEASTKAFAKAFASGRKASAKFGDNLVLAKSTVSGGGASVPVVIAFTPSVVDGALVLKPKTVSVNGDSKSVSAFKKSTIGKAARSLTTTRDICVASYLPETLTLTGLTVTKGAASLVASGTGVRLSGGLTTLGVCD